MCLIIYNSKYRVFSAPVWTPNDAPNDWTAAKLFVVCCAIMFCYFVVYSHDYQANADFHMHQFRTHALFCHITQEPLCVATSKMLPECHPVFKLLRPHFHGLIFINDLAKGSLVAAKVPMNGKERNEGVFGDGLSIMFGNVTSVGAFGNAALAIESYKTYNMEEAWFKNDLKARGMMDCSVIGNYPYRDDGLLIFEVLENYVKGILEIYFKSDSDVTGDAELQGWANDIVKNGKVKGFPGGGKIESVEQLVYICTNIIFTASAYHAAVNFSQVDYGAVVLNMPGSLWRDVPTKKGEVDEQFLLDMMPTKFRSIIQIVIVMFLSQPPDRFLGNTLEKYFTEDSALGVQKKFVDDLKAVEAKMKSKMETSTNGYPYDYMLPSRIPNSTSI
eukprot:m.252921 g.252921  ORF g.252921 m.252921 type:complete len:388 (+) comp16159_c0_seq4:2646-3809(+)